MAANMELRVFRSLFICVVAMASASVAQQPEGNQPGGESAVVRAGVNGITPPRCIHCPQPQY
ncbi:MAG: hypothetical protein ABJB97_06605, partial [Acidobacteriota bacterium]